MIREISDTLKLYYSFGYPKKIQKNSNKKRCVYLGIGGNIANVRRRFTLLLNYMMKLKSIDVVATSVILKNPPFGIKEQNDFYNSVIVIKTNLLPHKLLVILLQIEARFGRIRELKNGPRTLDIDILFIDNKKINTKRLQVPHPYWQERESVLIPLRFIQKVTQQWKC